MSIEELQQKMREWQHYQTRQIIYDKNDPRRIDAHAGIQRIQEELWKAGFDIGTSDFGRLQLTLLGEG